MTALLARHLPPNIVPIKPADLIWLAFTLSVSASMTLMLAGDFHGPMSAILAFVGAGGCAWLWLLARSLFRAEKPIERWNLYVVAGIIAVEGSSSLLHGYPAGGAWSETVRFLHNTESFICIGALVMVFAEVLSGYGNKLRKQELRFRQLFLLTFGITIIVSLLWVMNAAEGSLGGQLREAVLLSTALAAVIGTRFCISFRQHNPLVSTRKPRASGDHVLAERIVETLQEDRKFATPELKVADLAELLGEHEYKVTQCITGSLGYRNFNHLINSHRIESAKEALADPENNERPILSVAFDCGFNSLGPFNRAFKQQVGMTPRQFRAAAE